MHVSYKLICIITQIYWIARFAFVLLDSISSEIKPMMQSQPFLNKTTLELFTKLYNASQSSRALGWDTNAYLVQHYDDH
jgi:hypothetical protein